MGAHKTAAAYTPFCFILEVFARAIGCADTPRVLGYLRITTVIRKYAHFAARYPRTTNTRAAKESYESTIDRNKLCHQLALSLA